MATVTSAGGDPGLVAAIPSSFTATFAVVHSGSSITGQGLFAGGMATMSGGTVGTDVTLSGTAAFPVGATTNFALFGSFISTSTISGHVAGRISATSGAVASFFGDIGITIFAAPPPPQKVWVGPSGSVKIKNSDQRAELYGDHVVIGNPAKDKEVDEALQDLVDFLDTHHARVEVDKKTGEPQLVVDEAAPGELEALAHALSDDLGGGG